jgi:hypothetical protein
MNAAQMLAVVILGAVAVGVGIKALGHATAGHDLIRHGMADRPRAVIGMMWALTFVALIGIGAVIGGLLRALELARP